MSPDPKRPKITISRNHNASQTTSRLHQIRPATTYNSTAIRLISNNAVKRYNSIPVLAHLTQTVALPSAKVQQWLGEGRIYVAERQLPSSAGASAGESASEEEASSRIAGFAAAWPMDGILHLGHVSVALEDQEKGIGAAVVEADLERAREMERQRERERQREKERVGDVLRVREEEGRKARVLLMTYAEIPWNAPWYHRKFGFREVRPETLGLEHVEKIRYDREERKMERPGYSRCSMWWEQGVA